MAKIQEISDIYSQIKDKIAERLKLFKKIWAEGSDHDIFCELVFCILTPQSSAFACADAVKRLSDNDLVLNGEKDKLSHAINPVRFKNNKAGYIIEARNLFVQNKIPEIKSVIESFSDNIAAREWLVQKVKGISYKESSHFLRNIGFGENIAILDRHILRNLALYKVIDEIPKTIDKKKYLLMEEKMRKFSKKINIDIQSLDFVFWYKQTGKIFK